MQSSQQTKFLESFMIAFDHLGKIYESYKVKKS